MGVFRAAFDWAKAKLFVTQAAQSIQVSTAEFILAHAQANCPVDTGVLRASGQIIASAGSTQTHVVFTAPYATPVEMGHLTPSGTWVPPNPFMRNAMAAAVAAFPQIAASARFRHPWGSDVQHAGVSFDKD